MRHFVGPEPTSLCGWPKATFVTLAFCIWIAVLVAVVGADVRASARGDRVFAPEGLRFDNADRSSTRLPCRRFRTRSSFSLEGASTIFLVRPQVNECRSIRGV